MVSMAAIIPLLSSVLLAVTWAGDLPVTSPTGAVPAVTSVAPVTEPAEDGLDSGIDTEDTGPALTVSCQDELHCHCTLRNGTVDIQCRYGNQAVVLRWNVITPRPEAGTRFEIDLQTRGTVRVLPSFLDLKLQQPADGRPCVMFIVRDATLVDALYASEKTFPTEWHLERVNLRSLNGEQLSPAPHPLLLTVRQSRVGVLRVPPLPAGSRLTLDDCQVSEVTGLPPTPGDVPPLPPPEGAAGRPEVTVRKCRLDTLRTAALSIEDVPGQSPPSLLFTDNLIGEMERAAVTVRSSSCQLAFAGNTVGLLQPEVFSVAGGTLRIFNNTLHVPHAAAFRGFCGQVSFADNDVRVPPTFGALHFDPCARYSLMANTFQCPCDGVGWLAMFERRQRPSVLEVFYERLLRGSFCRTPAGPVPMAEFAQLEDCSGARLRSTLVLATATLAAAVLVLLLGLLLCWCFHRRRGVTTTKLQQPRLRRPTNLYTSGISAPISKHSASAAGAGRPVTAPSSPCLSGLSGVDAHHLGHYVTLEGEEDDGLYATIVYKKRRAPDPPPGSTPGPCRAAQNKVLNRCVSEGGIRLPIYGSLQNLPPRKLSGAGAELRGAEKPPEGIAEEGENPYLVPDGTASDYTEVPPQLYEEVLPVAGPARSGWAAPHQGKPSKDSGIGDDLYLETLPQEAAANLSADVYSPPVQPRRD
ncbi:uncharacterized protein LOC122380397 [Amphibalanus amphitrite]|uniref:uncharacterized protein LOC122380397 n=1 Tax=Amphibalanus amphitrite TaxID=1232801 RepID=UPI001C9158A2|nr:uncharacterized protein LOC122380397 [Amphibalanus amphitrite]